MKLYIMRHGPAEDFASTGRDFDRALTQAGRERVRQVAARLSEENEAPRVVVSSPLVRARQTADLVAPIALDSKHVHVDDALAPGGDAAGLVRAHVAKGSRRVMLVGHEPDLSGLVEELLQARFPRDMLKAMVVGLRMTKDKPGELRFVLEPKTLELTRA